MDKPLETHSIPLSDPDSLDTATVKELLDMGLLKPEAVEDMGFDCEDLDWLETTTVEDLRDLGFDLDGSPILSDKELWDMGVDVDGYPPDTPEPDPLDTPEPHTDKKIISDMIVETYNLALQFYGNNETKARKLLELAVYVPIFGSFGYKKMWWNLFQDPETKSLYEAMYEDHGCVNLAHVVPPVSLEGIKKQLDKVIPILELALLEKKSGDWLWMHIRLSSIGD